MILKSLGSISKAKKFDLGLVKEKLQEVGKRV